MSSTALHVLTALALLAGVGVAPPRPAVGGPAGAVVVPPTADQVLEDALVSVADEGVDAAWQDRALAGVVTELAGLEHLDALQADDTVVALVTIVGGRVTTVAELEQIDAANAMLLAEGVDDGQDVRPAVREVLAPLTAEALAAARAGDRSLDARPWVAAVRDLVVAGMDPVAVPGGATGTDDAVATGVGLGQLPGDLPWVAVVAAMGLLVGALGLLALRRRRADDSLRDEAVGSATVLEASRRMTSALDRDEVHRIALRAAVDLTGADAGAWIGRGPDGPAWGHATPGAPLAVPTGPGGVVARALETGQPATGDAAADPWLAGARGRVTALPVIDDGRVVGAIVVQRDDGRLPTTVPAAMASLGPVTGSALAAASAHRGAVDASLADALTGLPNRRRLDMDLAAIGSSGRFAVAMLDVDSFKHFNDTNGHAAGDLALQLVARALTAAVRADDTVYRYGGEEFCVLLPRARGDEVGDVARRMLAEVRDTVVPGGEHQPGGRVTVSVGVAVRREGERVPETLRRADEALYAAKRGGRDRVVVGAPA